MMQMRRDHWLVRFAYAGNIHLLKDFYLIQTITLCSLFWRVVIHAVAIAGISYLLGRGLAHWIVEYFAGDPMLALLPFIAAVFVAGMALFAAAVETGARKVGIPILYEAVTKRFCPLIRLSNDSRELVEE